MEKKKLKSEALQKAEPRLDDAAILAVLVKGDLSSLTDAQKRDHYLELCRATGLNPLLRPFEYIRLKDNQGGYRLVLYARKEATDQLRRIHGISITNVDIKHEGDLLIVTVLAKDATGRTDSDVGVVFTKGIFGDAAANAVMKGVTKAKRRVTISLTGLGMLDETEVESIPGATKVEITGPQPEQQAIPEVEPELVIVADKGAGLDKWKVSRRTAMSIINVCAALKRFGVTDEQMKAKLPKGVTSRTELTETQATGVIRLFNAWLRQLEQATENQTVEGEVVNE